VSSGAMAAGREALGFPELPRDPGQQMLAAAGQPRLMVTPGCSPHQITVAQVLLTAT
jgi:glutamate 5-kinase